MVARILKKVIKEFQAPKFLLLVIAVVSRPQKLRLVAGVYEVACHPIKWLKYETDGRYDFTKSDVGSWLASKHTPKNIS